MNEACRDSGEMWGCVDRFRLQKHIYQIYIVRKELEWLGQVEQNMFSSILGGEFWGPLLEQL